MKCFTVYIDKINRQIRIQPNRRIELVIEELNSQIAYGSPRWCGDKEALLLGTGSEVACDLSIDDHVELLSTNVSTGANFDQSRTVVIGKLKESVCVKHLTATKAR